MFCGGGNSTYTSLQGDLVDNAPSQRRCLFVSLFEKYGGGIVQKLTWRPYGQYPIYGDGGILQNRRIFFRLFSKHNRLNDDKYFANYLHNWWYSVKIINYHCA